MGAVITTLAERSFISPRGQIMHHQMSYGVKGTVSDVRDGQHDNEELWNITFRPVADKMGISLEEFQNRMYQKRKSGDWNEFAYKAKELKWVDHVVKIVEARPQIVAPKLTGPLATAP